MTEKKYTTALTKTAIELLRKCDTELLKQAKAGEHSITPELRKEIGEKIGEKLFSLLHTVYRYGQTDGVEEFKQNPELFEDED